jgi:pimeloyl-ACP methyl ester carboxylesterase
MQRVEFRRVSMHGHDVAFRSGGTGPVILLAHGMAGSSSTWRHVMPALAEHFTVVAPDVPGHGASAKPRGDYSLGALAASLRDSLTVLGHERATLVGRSLGGGVAMQFAYQFPERCERLVLVSSGGFGEDVNRLLAPYRCRVPSTWSRWDATDGPATRARRSFARCTASVYGRARSSVMSGTGATSQATSRRSSCAELTTTSSQCTRRTRLTRRFPGSRLEIFEGVGHYPNCEDPERFVKVVEDFMTSTTPAAVSTPRRREPLLRNTRASGRSMRNTTAIRHVCDRPAGPAHARPPVRVGTASG